MLQSSEVFVASRLSFPPSYILLALAYEILFEGSEEIITKKNDFSSFWYNGTTTVTSPNFTFLLILEHYDDVRPKKWL